MQKTYRKIDHFLFIFQKIRTTIKTQNSSPFILYFTSQNPHLSFFSSLPKHPPSLPYYLIILSKIIYNNIQDRPSTMQEQIAKIEQLYNKIPQQLITNFTTSLQNYQLSHSQLELSTELDEEALNTLLKDMLEQTDLPRFQFVVEGYILRGKLKSHILRYQLTAEQIITIQYVLAFEQMDDHRKAQEKDWISCVATIPGPDGSSGIVSSLYNGSVVIYSTDLEKLSTIEVDDDALKSVQMIPSSEEYSYYLFCGGLGQNLKVHLVNLTGKKCKSTELSYNNHKGSVNSISLSPGIDLHIATGGSNGQLNIWNIPENFQIQGTANSIKTKKNKKQKLQLNALTLLAEQPIHNGTIQSINWFNNEEILTSSGEHKIVLTNVAKMKRVQTILTRDSVAFSIDSAQTNILSAHEDGQIRLWDIRNPSKPQNSFKSHSKWTSSVKFGQNKNYFVSGSYDHTVKIWDMRSSFPLQNINAEQQKVLCVDWLNQNSIIHGGSDSSIHLHRAN